MRVRGLPCLVQARLLVVGHAVQPVHACRRCSDQRAVQQADIHSAAGGSDSDGPRGPACRLARAGPQRACRLQAAGAAWLGSACCTLRNHKTSAMLPASPGHVPHDCHKAGAPWPGCASGCAGHPPPASVLLCTGSCARLPRPLLPSHCRVNLSITPCTQHCCSPEMLQGSHSTLSLSLSSPACHRE